MNEPKLNSSEPDTNRVGFVEALRGILVLLVITLGSLTAVVKGMTIFPFDGYRMYSGLHTEDFSYWKMYGIARDSGSSGGEVEIDISAQQYWGLQMHIGRKITATNRVIRRSEDNADEIETAMSFLRDLYNDRQQSGLHDGPPIKQLRMYKNFWKLRSDLSNIDEPYKRVLVAESSVLK